MDRASFTSKLVSSWDQENRCSKCQMGPWIHPRVARVEAAPVSRSHAASRASPVLSFLAPQAEHRICRAHTSHPIEASREAAGASPQTSSFAPRTRGQMASGKESSQRTGMVWWSNLTISFAPSRTACLAFVGTTIFRRFTAMVDV